MSGSNEILGELDFSKAIEASVDTDKMTILSEKVDQLKNLRGEENPDHVNRVFKNLVERIPDISLATLEGVAKLFKIKEEKLSREEIPSILNELNMAEIKLTTGEKITVKDEIKASVNEANRRKLMEEMAKIEAEFRGIEFEDALYNVKGLFKEKLISDFDAELESELIQKGIGFDHKIDIHYQTLNKYVRDNLDQGLPIPESLSVFTYQETKIK